MSLFFIANAWYFLSNVAGSRFEAGRGGGHLYAPPPPPPFIALVSAFLLKNFLNYG